MLQLLSGMHKPKSLFLAETVESSESEYISTSQTEITSQYSEEMQNIEQILYQIEEEKKMKKINAKVRSDEDIPMEDINDDLNLKLSPFYSFIENRFQQFNLFSEKKK